MTTKTRKTYIGKERDDESYLGGFGVRKYDYAAGRFTSPDVLWEKYMTWSPYNYCGNNPMKRLDPSGYFWAGTDGNSVSYDITNESVGGFFGWFGFRKSKINITGGLPGADLTKLIEAINGSGSSTAFKQFDKVGSNSTQTNVCISDEFVDNGKDGRSLPHDANGNVLDWDSGKMSFSGTPGYNSNGEYSQVTMELFLGNIATRENCGGLTAIQYMVSVFGHESDHSTNQGVIDMIRYNQNKTIEGIEKPAINLQIQILKEMK
jgi:RHS repeat-associated protein